MFKDPDVAAFVDAGASVSVKLPEAVPAVSPVDTMFQGTDLTKPKLRCGPCAGFSGARGGLGVSVYWS
jgi:hypothetical protein